MHQAGFHRATRDIEGNGHLGHAHVFEVEKRNRRCLFRRQAVGEEPAGPPQQLRPRPQYYPQEEQFGGGALPENIAQRRQGAEPAPGAG